MLLEQAHRVARLDVLRQHEHTDLGVELHGCEARRRCPRRCCVGGMRISTSAQSGFCVATARINPSTSPASATTSTPASPSSRTIPSRVSITSSATTTRMCPSLTKSRGRRTVASNSWCGRRGVWPWADSVLAPMVSNSTLGPTRMAGVVLRGIVSYPRRAPLNSKESSMKSRIWPVVVCGLLAVVVVSAPPSGASSRNRGTHDTRSLARPWIAYEANGKVRLVHVDGSNDHPLTATLPSTGRVTPTGRPTVDTSFSMSVPRASGWFGRMERRRSRSTPACLLVSSFRTRPGRPTAGRWRSSGRHRTRSRRRRSEPRSWYST